MQKMQGFQHEKRARDDRGASCRDRRASTQSQLAGMQGGRSSNSPASSQAARGSRGHSDQRNGSHPARRRALVALAALTLAACAHSPSEPQIVVKEVRVPVVVPCPIDTSEPAYVDTLDALKAAAARGSDAVVALLIGGRSQRDAQIAGLKAQAEACGG
jgi:hypothetical protein